MHDYAYPSSVPSRLAISIRQPWAWAILYAGKRIENRSWYTPHRGKIYIHAGLSVDREAVTDLSETIRAVAEPRPIAYCGGLIAIATLRDCVLPEDVANEQRSWATGPWCLVLDEVEPLIEPIALKGALGLFPINPRAELTLMDSVTKYPF